MTLCNEIQGQPFREIKMAELNNRRNESLGAAEAFDKKTKKQKRKKITDYWKRTEELMQDNKSKSVIEFDSGSSIKSVTIQTNPNVKITTRFMKGKPLMFAKTSVISFVYDMNNAFCFSEDNPKMHAIYVFNLQFNPLLSNVVKWSGTL